VTLIRPGVLLLAALMAAPALWRAAVDGQLDLNSALTRFLIAVPVAILMVAGLQWLTADYRRTVASDLLPDQDAAVQAGAKDGAARGTDSGAEPIRRSTEVAEEPAAAV